jgi:hypothetical protein
MSFLRDYMEYSTGNEAPELFHAWGAYTCLSAAISRRVWLPFEDTAIYPNLYVMFVGPAGNGKTWAMRKAKRILAELGNIPISGSVETPPGLGVTDSNLVIRRLSHRCVRGVGRTVQCVRLIQRHHCQ